MESYVLILESIISELTGVLLGDVKKPDHIKKLCDSAKQFVDKEQGTYFSRVANNCERMMRWEAENGMLNSAYGMCVTDIVRDDAVYFNGEWVTAHARHNLWDAILEFGPDYIYEDTDSIKGMNFDKHKNFFADHT